MKVFISIRVPIAGDERAAIAEHVVQIVRASGHQPFVAYQEIINHGLMRSADFMPFVRQHIQEADLVLQWIDRARKIEPLGQVLVAQAPDRGRLLLENGDVVKIPPGHDAWVECGEPFVGIEMVSAEEYAKS